MTNKIAFWLAALVSAAILWDVLLNDSFWVWLWGRRLFTLIEWIRFW